MGKLSFQALLAKQLEKNPAGTKVTSPPCEGEKPAAPPRNNESLTGKVADSAQDVFVSGGGVDRGGVDVAVPGSALNDANIASAPVDIGESGVPEVVEGEPAIEAGALLPVGEHEAESADADPIALATDEQRGVEVDSLPIADLPADEGPHLVNERVREEDLLGGGLVAAPLEDGEGDAPLDAWTAAIELARHYVADVESGDLELAQGGAEGDSEDDVIAESVAVLTADGEEPGLLGIGQSDGGSPPLSETHGLPPDCASAAIVPKAETKSNSGPLIVVKRTEDEFSEWIATESGFLQGIARFDDEPVRFESYQAAFLATRAPYRCVEKSRQVGYSWLFACEAIARSHLRDAHNSIFVSYNLSDSKEKIAYAAQLHEELPLEFQKKKVIDSKLELGFRSNSSSKRVSRIISHPSRAPRGKKGDIYLDELAHYANDREVYKGSTALILRAKGQMTVCSSPLGRRGQFWEIARQELQPYGSYWRQKVPWWLCSFFCVDVVTASRDALKMTTEERVARFGTQGIKEQFSSLPLDDFQQEFEVIYVDEAMSFFPYELILPATNDSLELADDFSQVKQLGRLHAGFDVGRKRDFSELAIFDELDDGRFICRLLKRYDKVKFQIQEASLRQMLNMLPIGRMLIDQNGIGMHLTENLTDDYPQVEGVTFTGPSKETWATDFKIGLQKSKIVLPRDRELVSQIHSIRRTITPAGRTQLMSTDPADKGHADRFWACALACSKDRSLQVGETPLVEIRIID